VTLFDLQDATRDYFGRIHRAALILTGNPWDADDLTQECFLCLAKQRHSYQGRSSLYTYLYGILLNLERRSRRQSGMARRKLQVVWDKEAQDERSVPGADSPLETAEWKKSLWARVAELPDGHRQALVLRFGAGLRYDEIADVMECPLGTVKSRIFHALAGLRRKLEEEGGDIRQLPEFPGEELPHAV